MVGYLLNYCVTLFTVVLEGTAPDLGIVIS
jgi:hypothetical protein